MNKLQELVDSGASRSELREYLQQHNESVVDLENVPKQNHNWTDRGLKVTCENAGHPYHETWKRKPMA